MSSFIKNVQVELTIFLRGGPFTALRNAVMDATAAVDSDPSVTDDEHEWYDELYDAVDMAAEDPVDDESAKHGVVGAAELRLQIRAMRLDHFNN